MISYEAAESGARVLIEDGQFGVPWEDASEDDRAAVLARVRAILEAATPHLLAGAKAEALDEAAEAWRVRMDTVGRGTVEAKTFMQRRAAAERKVAK